MHEITINNILYKYKEQFDVNLTINYENDRWGSWQIIREFISNALDSVGGDASRVSITMENGYVIISDDGPGYPIVYAKRIGASSKKNDSGSIGQFGEGTKLALLTCLRGGLNVRLASQNWLIEPKVTIDEDGIQVLVFDIYESEASIRGSVISLTAVTEIQEMVSSKDSLFLQFNSQEPLFSNINGGIYPKGDQAKVYNKGVYIKDIDAMFSYALSIGELNRDRDVIDDDKMCRKIRDLWNTLDNESLIREYYLESERIGNFNINQEYKEFRYCVYPEPQNQSLWVKVFHDIYGDKAVIYTSELASREASNLGYQPVRLEYNGMNLAKYLKLPTDVQVIGDDYEFQFASNLTEKETERLAFLSKVAEVVNWELPKNIKIYEEYAKGSGITGVYNPNKDEVLLKRERLNKDMVLAVETWLHELNHRDTGADDYDRIFSNGLSMALSKLVIQHMEKVGLPVTLVLSNRGFRLPNDFSFSSVNMTGVIAIAGSEILIKVCGRVLRASLPGLNLKSYAAEREVTFYKGNFYLNVPLLIRKELPSQVLFNISVNVAQG
ncbi:MAG: ATP-binding protein [Dehalobacterium sp.]